MIKADLHIHSHRSDGTYTAHEIVDYAVIKGLTTIAITDHDVIFSDMNVIPYAAQKGITLIPGIELSSEQGRHSIHIVGLFIDETSTHVSSLISTIIHNRTERNRAMIEKFRQNGITITMEDLAEIARGDIIARPHFSEWLIKQGLARNTWEAFDQYLGNGARCHVPRVKIPASQYFESIHRDGGVAILAHPGLYDCNNHAEYVELVLALAAQGLDGIEVFTSAHDKKKTKFFQTIAEKNNLIVSGGSDFHGALKSFVDLGKFEGADQLGDHVPALFERREKILKEYSAKS